MEDSWQSRLRASVGDSKLWRLRRQVIVKTARDFMAVGNVLSRPIEGDDETKRAVYAFGSFRFVVTNGR